MTEKKKPIGALWQKSGNYGDYMSGEIEIAGIKHRFNVYPNSYKKESKHPDFRIFLSEPKKQQVITVTKNTWTEEDIPF